MTLHVLVMKADLGGSSFYRIDEPARVLRRNHPDLTIEIETDIDVNATRFIDGRVEVAEVRTDADVIVLQRPLTQGHSEVARVARQQGIRVVVDIDDDFHNVHPDNIAAASTDPAQNPWHNKLWLTRTLRFSDVVTVSTPALLKYASAPGRPGPVGVVIRNRIPERALLVRGRHPEALTSIGWAGTLQTHPRDMARARGALAKVNAPFVVVGDDIGIARALDVPADRVTLAASWTDTVDKYWQTIADSFGVGIAPLEPSKFNRAKSWLKPAEYCALGIPYVASSTPEYQRIVAESGSGFTAESTGRWSSALASALDHREEYAIAGRAWAAKNTLELHADEWLAAWTLAARSK